MFIQYQALLRMSSSFLSYNLSTFNLLFDKIPSNYSKNECCKIYLALGLAFGSRARHCSISSAIELSIPFC